MVGGGARDVSGLGNKLDLASPQVSLRKEGFRASSSWAEDEEVSGMGRLR